MTARTHHSTPDDTTRLVRRLRILLVLAAAGCLYVWLIVPLSNPAGSQADPPIPPGTRAPTYYLRMAELSIERQRRDAKLFRRFEATASLAECAWRVPLARGWVECTGHVNVKTNLALVPDHHSTCWYRWVQYRRGGGYYTVRIRQSVWTSRHEDPVVPRCVVPVGR